MKELPLSGHRGKLLKGKTERISSKIRNKIRISTFITFIQIVLEVPDPWQSEKKKK